MAAPTTKTSTPVPVQTDALLEQTVKDQLDRGVSLDDVIAKLAGSLAASVAAQLGIDPKTAQAQLTQAFSQALKPTDTGPPRSNAERASSLVSRLRQIAGLATGVTNGDTGQSIRLIAGQRSDADKAKATPAPDPDSILSDALAALAGPASSATGAAAPALTVPSAPAAGDGRTVTLDDPAQAIATGGDTPLGRILTRAIQAGQSPATSTPPLSGTSPRLGAAATGSLTTSVALSQATAAGTAALDAFLQAFAGALAHADASPATAKTDASPAAPAAGAAPITAPSNASSPLSYAIPFVHEALPVTPATPASTLPQTPQVDANAVVDQILRGMNVRTADGQSEVRLRLVPESLGDVSVKLMVSGGAVDASLTAHTAEAQNALAGGQNQLAKALADAGLKLQSFTVGLAGGGFSGTGDQSRSNDSWARPGSRRIGGVEAADPTDALDETALLTTPSFGPPIYSASSLPGTLNRLV